MIDWYYELTESFDDKGIDTNIVVMVIGSNNGNVF